jgi:3',5'-cyclic AMP phosphodiesterase CpdA
MKIAHISDLHVNLDIRDTNLPETEAALDFILDKGVDHIVLTGDLADNGELEALEALREMFRRRDLLDRDRLTVVIGNHDIFGGVQNIEEIFDFPEKCRAVDFEEKVRAFHRVFIETYEGAEYARDDNPYPFAKRVGDALFVAFNTVARYSSTGNPFASNGVIDDDQRELAAALLERFGGEAGKRIVLTHHHFKKMKVVSRRWMQLMWENIENRTMKMRKRKKAARMFKERGVDFVMHGHVHDSEIYKWKELDISNAGASIKNGKSDTLRVNILDLAKKEIDASIEKINFKKQRKKLSA